ncbi:MAG: hypothetical protein L0Z62_28135 [Gemmataceae bacterium]|nr:hypothetical protein [Gemmataceae bacterium]
MQRGATQHSYVRYVDVIFESSAGLASLLSAGRVQLTRFGLDGSGGTTVSLGGVLSVSGNRLLFDFGTAGLGGNAISTAGDGYYEVAADIDGDGSRETRRYFYRLLGDVNADRTVNTLDEGLILAAFGTTNPERDVNGDGIVNTLDRVYAMRSFGRSLASGLLLDG